MEGRSGEMGIKPEVGNLILDMSQVNPRGGAPRFHCELIKRGIRVSEATVICLVALSHAHRKTIHIHVTNSSIAASTGQRGWFEILFSVSGNPHSLPLPDVSRDTPFFL